jgi:hypothetical protein
MLDRPHSGGNDLGRPVTALLWRRYGLVVELRAQASDRGAGRGAAGLPRFDPVGGGQPAAVGRAVDSPRASCHGGGVKVRFILIPALPTVQPRPYVP